jgi:acyl transferase domain-containing protein/acyl carrier protein
LRQSSPENPFLTARWDRAEEEREPSLTLETTDSMDIASAGIARDPIAIVGIGCRFPGGVTGAGAFWRLLRDGVDAIAQIPEDRMDVSRYYDPRPASPGKMTTRLGGFLERIDMFDAGFFGISPREADRMDPQQRILMEIAWEALEDAGQPVDRMDGSMAGVFIGMWLNDYESRLFADPSAVDFYMTTGSGRYSASGRLSYFLGLQGPSLTVDTACSSSLVAVHLACQSIWRKECSIALAGGANVILQPHISIAYSQSKMMAPDGRCKFGDSRADGYVRSEGAGIVVLKPLSSALQDGDPIYALIEGSAVNNDGRSSGYMTTPARGGQEELLRRAYRDAGISAGRVRYVEAHGTGTRAGDPVEVGALGTVLVSDRPACRPCYVGSVKTNFGHTEGAAGIAGLIKTALILRHRKIPASLHLEELNPAIPWKDYPLVIPRVLTPWPDEFRPAVAGVSAFGIAGTNAHVVLTEAPRRGGGNEAPGSDSTCLLPLSAHSPEALVSLAGAYASALGEDDAPSLYDTCYTASLRRTHHEHRLAVVADSRESLRQRLLAFSPGASAPGVSTGIAEPGRALKVVFVFPGQGSQWVGMGRQLMSREPAFRESLEQCERAMRPFVNWSLEQQLHLEPDSPGYRMNEIDVIQPSLLSIEIALAALWRAWGVEPDAVLGHSMGEVGAAFVAGALSLEDAMCIICSRSSLLRGVSGKGVMAVVALPMDEAKEALAGFEDRLSVAVSNSSRSTVLSGDPAAMAEILEKLQGRGIFCRLVKVDVASHSPQMDHLTDDLGRSLAGIEPLKAKIPLYSTVTAESIEGSALDASYWVRNLRRPVLFSRTVQGLLDEEYAVFIELSPHPILLPSIEETAHDSGRQAFAMGSLEREKDERASLLGSIARLYAAGYPVNWKRFFPSGGKVVALPAYPWQRQRFWMETRTPRVNSLCVSSGIGVASGEEHPLLGTRLPDVASLPGCFIWENDLDRPTFRDYLRKGHFDSSPVPEAVYFAMASAAADAVFGEKRHRISSLAIQQPLSLTDSGESLVQFILTSSQPGLGSFQIFSRDSNGIGKWKRRVSGEIEAGHVRSDWFYELEWKQKSRQPDASQVPKGQSGRWLIFADRGGFGASLAEKLESRGEDYVLVFTGDAYERQGPRRYYVAPRQAAGMRELLHDALQVERTSCRGIVYLWGLDATSPEITGRSLDESQAVTCDGVLHLIQSLVKMEFKAAPRLWLVSQGAQAIGPADTISVEQAPLWGLGRVIALEHPNLWGGLVDLPASDKLTSTGAEAATMLSEELLHGDGEDQAAIRGGRRFVPRLVRSRACTTEPKPPLSLRPDATYLITGGLGSLGLRLAGWLVERGANNLVLTSRTGLPERSTWATLSPESEVGKRIAAVLELEKSGARIHVAQADVANEIEMSRLWEELSIHPPIRGIIHAAGIVAASPLVELRAEEFHDVLRSKMIGAWLLHQYSKTRKGAEKLDFFVLFSSGASVWGSQGLAHYAAANHFLDALAHHRASQGLPALSVNWGWWEGAGIVSGHLADLFGRVGLQGLPSGEALAALAYLLETRAIQTTVADVDWEVFGPIFEAKRKRPLLNEVIVRQQAQVAAAGAENETKSRLLFEIQQASPFEKRPLLQAHIRSQVAEILGFKSADGIDPKQGFFKMGMDSIMTVQLRNRLELNLGCTLPPTLAFEYPTVEALTKFLGEAVVRFEPLGAAVVPSASEKKSRAPEMRHEDLSEGELVELLAKKLDQIR